MNQFLLSMPGGSEWIVLILVFSLLIIAPAVAIYYYSKSKRLSQEVESLRVEKDTLLAKLLEK